MNESCFPQFDPSCNQYLSRSAVGRSLTCYGKKRREEDCTISSCPMRTIGSNLFSRQWVPKWWKWMRGCWRWGQRTQKHSKKMNEKLQMIKEKKIEKRGEEKEKEKRGEKGGKETQIKDHQNRTKNRFRDRNWCWRIQNSILIKINWLQRTSTTFSICFWP